MQLTAQVKLLPSSEQSGLLLETVEKANAACNYVSGVAFEAGIFGKFSLHKLVYHDVRERFPLSAQVVVRLIQKVADAYKVSKQTRATFRPHGAIAYDSRILSFNLAQSEVSIWSIGGRQKIPFACGERQRQLLSGKRGEADLCLVDGEWYLFVACEVEEPKPDDINGFLGVDLGVVNIATDSDGKIHSSAQVNGLRHRHRKLRAKLQSKGTKAVKRLLKKRRRKESRFAKNENHRISKTLVQKAKDTGRGLALEDLSGIRERITVRKSQRSQHHSWSFFDLRTKIEYKARRAGVVVVLIDPRNTSRTCPSCGLIDKRNRPSQATFRCIGCDYCGQADIVAATNIRRRAEVIRPNVSDEQNIAHSQGQAMPL